jgi:hypothetical protein
MASERTASAPAVEDRVMVLEALAALPRAA